MTRLKTQIRFRSFERTRVEDIVRIPSKKSLLMEFKGMRLTLRAAKPTLQTIEEDDDQDSEQGVVVTETCVVAWLTDDVFVYNTPAQLDEMEVKALVDVFLRLGFQKLQPAKIQPQI